jgi:hypothetical protein
MSGLVKPAAIFIHIPQETTGTQKNHAGLRLFLNVEFWMLNFE